MEDKLRFFLFFFSFNLKRLLVIFYGSFSDSLKANAREEIQKNEIRAHTHETADFEVVVAWL